jgi:hypothetical protein
LGFIFSLKKKLRESELWENLLQKFTSQVDLKFQKKKSETNPINNEW